MIKKEITTQKGVVGYLLLDDLDADLAKRAVNLIGSAPWRYPVFKLNGEKVKIHREIAKRMGILPVWARGYNRNQIVDHINGDTFDCRRSNIRVGSFNHNAQNKTKVRKGSASGLKGVSREDDRWVAYIVANGERIRLGRSKDKYELARLYDAKAIELHGSFATTNEMLGLYPEQNND